MHAIIIDGSNAVQQLMGDESGIKRKYLPELEKKRSTYFLHCLMRWAFRSRAGELFRVFFDGYYREIVPRKQRCMLGVQFSQRTPADNLIVEEVHACVNSGKCERVTVVTADRMLGDMVRAIGAEVMSPLALEIAIITSGIDLHRFDGAFTAINFGYV